MSDIDWSKAPEWATKYGTAGEDEHKVFYNDNNYQYTGEHMQQNVFNSSNGYKIETLILIEKKPSKPVYTQSMADNGELPLVGVECVFKHTSWGGYIKAIVLAVTDEYLILKEVHSSHEQHYHLKDISFKAIDTRTDEEKALDDLMDTYWDDCNEKVDRHSPIVIKIIDAIKAGKIHNVTWSK